MKLLFWIACISCSVHGMIEHVNDPPSITSGGPEAERQKLHETYYGPWPIKWPGASDGMLKFYSEREEWIMRNSEPESQKRFEFWLDFVQMQIHPTFTNKGYELFDLPEDLHAKLKKYFATNYLEQEAAKEGDAGGGYEIMNGSRKLVNLPPDLKSEVARTLQGTHEAWAGNISLEFHGLYGIRVYEKGSALKHHVDQAETHIISAILHIAHDYDNQTDSWPIEVVGHDGLNHKVEMAEGQMVLYESSKCYHGRPGTFQGKYYASAFLHFKPHVWNYNAFHRVAALPPHWRYTYERWKHEIRPTLFPVRKPTRGVHIVFKLQNSLQEAVALYWENLDGKLERLGVIQPGEEKTERSWLMQAFVAKDLLGRTLKR